MRPALSEGLTTALLMSRPPSQVVGHMCTWGMCALALTPAHACRCIGSDETATAWVGCRAGCLSRVVSATQEPGQIPQHVRSLQLLSVDGPMQSYSARPERASLCKAARDSVCVDGILAGLCWNVSVLGQGRVLRVCSSLRSWACLGYSVGLHRCAPTGM